MTKSREEIIDSIGRIQGDLAVGAHYPTAALVETQLAALAYLVEHTPTYRPSMTVPAGLDRQEFLRVLQADFHKDRPYTEGTMLGMDGERVDVSTIPQMQARQAYRSGVADALDWIVRLM